MNDTGFSMVISNIHIPSRLLPFEIEPRTRIAIAGTFEVDRFKAILGNAGYFSNFFVPFGSTAVETEIRDGSRIDYIPPAEEVMYVVDFNGFNGHLSNLKLAGCLIVPKFKFGMDTMYKDKEHNSTSMGGFLSYHQLEMMKDENRKPVAEFGEKHLHTLAHYYRKIASDLAEESRVRRALELYSDTETLPERSGLLALSYFSILESLVTNGRVEGESITNQLKFKIKLLLNRSKGSCDHNVHFMSIAFDTLWKKLYGLRSDIAHGNPYLFTRDYQALIGLSVVNKYLDEVVSTVIRLSIDEPELVDDLRVC